MKNCAKRLIAQASAIRKTLIERDEIKRVSPARTKELDSEYENVESQVRGLNMPKAQVIIDWVRKLHSDGTAKAMLEAARHGNEPCRIESLQIHPVRSDGSPVIGQKGVFCVIVSLQEPVMHASQRQSAFSCPSWRMSTAEQVAQHLPSADIAALARSIASGKVYDYMRAGIRKEVSWFRREVRFQKAILKWDEDRLRSIRRTLEKLQQENLPSRQKTK